MINLRQAITPLKININNRPLELAEEADIADSSQFGRGWASAAMNEQGAELMWQSNQAAIAGDVPQAQGLRQQGEDVMRRAKTWAPTVQNFTDIGGVGDAVDWAAGAAGNVRSSVAPALGGLAGAAVGGLGGLAVGGLPGAAAGATWGARTGAGLAGYNTMTESNAAQSMMDPTIAATRTPEEIRDVSRMTGAAQGALEAIVPAGMATSIVKGAGKTAAKELAEQGAKRYVGGKVAREAGEEFLTEFAQNPIGDMGQNYLAGKPMGDIDWEAALNAGMAGAVGGGMMGGVGGTADVLHNKLGGAVDTARDIAANPMQAVGDGIANLGAKAGEIKAGLEGRAERKALKEDYDAAMAAHIEGLARKPADPFDLPGDIKVDGTVEADKAAGGYYSTLADKILSHEARDDYTQEDKQAAARFKTHGDWSAFRQEVKSAKKSKVVDEIAAEFEGGSKSSMMWANPSQPAQQFEAPRTQHGETIGKLSEIMLNKNEAVRGLSSIKGTGEAGRRLTNNLMAWSAEGYKIGTNEDGESVITVPRRFTSELPVNEAVKLVEESAKLVRAQGLVADPEQHKKDTAYVIQKIKDDAAMHAEPKDFVMQRLTPVAQDQIKTSQVPELIALLEKLDGKAGPATRQRLTELFGDKVDEVLERFIAKPKYGKQVEGDNGRAVSGIDEDGELTFDEEGDDDLTQYTSGSEGDNSIIGVGQDNMPFSRLTDIEKMNTVLGSFENRIDARAYPVGAVRRVRDSMKGQPAEKIFEAENSIIETHADELENHPTLGEAFGSIARGEFNPADMDPALRRKVLTEINRNFQYVQVKKVKPDADPRKVTSTDFKHELTLADKAAGKTEYDLTAGDGFVFLERDYLGNGKKSNFPVYMKRLLAADSREIGNREAPDSTREDKAEGLAADYEHIQYMLNSILTSGRGFTGRVGYREKPKGEIVWLDKTFPDNLKLGDKGTVADAKAQLDDKRRADPGKNIGYAENHKERVAALLELAKSTESAGFKAAIYKTIKKGATAVLQMYREIRNQWEGEADGFGGTPTGKDKDGVVDVEKRTSQRRAFNKNTDPSLADHSTDEDRVASEGSDTIQTGIRREDPAEGTRRYKPIHRNDDGGAAGLSDSALSASYGGGRSTNTGTKPVRYRVKGEKIAELSPAQESALSVEEITAKFEKLAGEIEAIRFDGSNAEPQTGLPGLTDAGRVVNALTPKQRAAEAKLQQAQERVVELLDQGVEKLLEVIGGLDMSGLNLINAALFGREPAITNERRVTDSRYDKGIAYRQYNSDGSGIKTKGTGETYKSGVKLPGLANMGASAINRIIFNGKDEVAAQKLAAALIRHKATVDDKIKARRTGLEKSDGKLGRAGQEAAGRAGDTDSPGEEAGVASGQLRGQADRGGVDAPGVSGRGRPGEDRNSQRRTDGTSGGDVSASAEKVPGADRGRAGNAEVDRAGDSNRNAGAVASNKGSTTADLAKQDAWVLKIANLSVKDAVAYIKAMPADKLDKAFDVLDSFYPVDNSNPFWQRNNLDNYTDAMDKSVFEAQDALRDRLGEVSKDSNQTANNKTKRTKGETEALKAETTAELHRLLGDDIKVDFKAFFKDGASGRWTPKQTGNIISLALNGDVLGTRYHEALHEFFNMLTKGGAENVQTALTRVATSPILLKKLDRLLDGHPAAQAQVKSSPEEALAFMFQFWATGALKIGPETKTTFEHIRDALAAVAKKLYSLLDGAYRKEYNKEKAQKLDAQFAENVFKSFMAGSAADKSTRQVFIDALKNNAEAHDKAIENLGTTVDAIYQKVGKLVFSAEAVLEQSNKYFAELAPVYHQQAGTAMKSFKDGKAAGAVFESTQSVTAKWLNQLDRVLAGDGKYERADLDLAVDALQRQKRPTAQVAGEIYDKVLRYYDQMFDYLNDSDVRRLDMDQIDPETGTHGVWVKMEKRQKYFTDLWDTNTLSTKKDEFISDLLTTHRKQLEHLAKQATKEAQDLKNNPHLAPNTAADLERRRVLAEFEASGKAIGKANFKELTAEDVAEAIFMRLLNAEGKIDVDTSDTSLGLSPAASSINRRQLDWLDKDVFAKYKSKDLVRIMTTYTRSMVKRAEHQKRLGYGGDVVNTAVDKGFLFELGGDELVGKAEKVLPHRVLAWKKAKAAALEKGLEFDEPFPTLRLVGYHLAKAQTIAETVGKGGSDKEGLKAYADKLGAAAKKLEPAVNAIRAAEGVLGSEISNGMRNFNSAITVYTQFRLLPLTLFTSFNDVVGIAVNGGEMKDAWNAFVSGVRAIKASWTGEMDSSTMMKRAEAFGAVDAAALMESLGQGYGSAFMGDKARRASNWLFKVNGMQGWNRGVRAAAVTVAERAILDWAKNGVNMKDPAEVARFERLYGKGADPKSIALDPDGNLDAMNDQNRAAVNRWVFDAVMSPNPAVRAIWMSDPRMQPFSMLKNFTYTMHRVMIKGVLEQAKLGNFRPALAVMAGYVPIAIAGGALKEMLVPGEEPPWMQGGLDDYLEYGFARAGLGGVPQMYLGDLVQGDPVGILGPFVDQIRDLGLSPLPEVRVNLSPFDGDSAFIKERSVFGEVLGAVNPLLKRTVQ